MHAQQCSAVVARGCESNDLPRVRSLLLSLLLLDASSAGTRCYLLFFTYCVPPDFMIIDDCVSLAYIYNTRTTRTGLCVCADVHTHTRVRASSSVASNDRPRDGSEGETEMLSIIRVSLYMCV